MITYRAEWILPVTGPPIHGGCVTVDGDRVVAVGSDPPASAIDLGSVAVLPGLVNAHTHLELSYLQGRVPPVSRFDEWVRRLMDLRRQEPDPASASIIDAAREAIRAARATGTALVGDVSNTLVTVQLLREAGMPAQVFFELIGFNPPDPVKTVELARARVETLARDRDGVRIALAPHAPYSVSPGLFKAIADDTRACAPGVSTVHLGETAEEVELLRDGTGVIRTMLERLGVWTDEWRVPRVSPVEYLARTGFLRPGVLVVHGVHLTDPELQSLSAMGVALVSCPRSNTHVGAGRPPLERFYAAGVEVAFGTDSLASADDLNVFAELAAARRIAPSVPARVLLRGATLNGARALGIDRFGSLEPGSRAWLIAVRVPPAVGDVEEYLVSETPGAAAISWLRTSADGA